MQILHSHLIAASNREEKLASLLENISPQVLREWVQKISIPRHFLMEPTINKEISEWLAEMFRTWGYQVQRHGEARNVLARSQPDAPEAILVGAHFDSVPGSPGADDNASAVAAMLGCAAACSLWRPLPALMFVAFNREEEGFLGSSEFVEEFLTSCGTQVRCAHILEMVAYASSVPGSQHLPTALPIQLPGRGDFLGLLANHHSSQPMRQIMARSRAYTADLPVIGLEVVPGVERVFPVLARSDHVPFWKHQIPAVMWTDTAEFRNPNYHKPSDTPETLNYEFLRRVTQLLTASVLG
jgi:hypothetical protein